MNTAKHNFIRLICLCALTLFPFVSQASPPDRSAQTKERHYWANMGGGFASVPGGLGEDDGGISGGLSLSYRIGGSLFSIRAVENSEFKLDLWGYSGPPDKVWDIGMLYGRVTKATHGLASISAGVGIVGASHNGKGLPLHMGIPLDVQLFWTPSSVLGFGIYGFANVNAYKSFYGMLVCVQLCREL